MMTLDKKNEDRDFRDDMFIMWQPLQEVMI